MFNSLSSWESQGLSSNLNLGEDAVEGNVGVLTITGVLLAIISLCPKPDLHLDVLRDSRVPRIKFLSIHCYHYDSACLCGHKEARYKQVMARHGEGTLTV